MNRVLLLMLLILSCFCSGGCAVRALTLHSFMEHQVQIPDGGKRESIEVDGAFYHPNATMIATSPLSRADTAAFYEEALHRAGWDTFSKESSWAEKTKSSQPETKDVSFSAERHVHWGKMDMGQEELWITLSADDKSPWTHVGLNLTTDYAWDKVPYVPAYVVMYGIGAVPVIATGGLILLRMDVFFITEVIWMAPFTPLVMWM